MKNTTGLRHFLLSSIILLLCVAGSHAANFSIHPIRVFFKSTANTTTLNIQNESDDDFTIQMSTFLWNQDQDGKDVYEGTKDIIFFPKIAVIKGSEKKIIRLGTKKPRSNVEQTYRIYLDEIKNPEASEGTNINFLMKVGVPIFIPPLHTEPDGSIENPELAEGSLHMAVKNKGNVHFIIRAVRVTGNAPSGEEVYSTETAGGYLHAGIAKKFAFDIPQDSCSRINRLRIQVETDRDLNLGKTIDITKEMCRA